MIKTLGLYTNWMARNPTTALVFIGLKVLVCTMLYQEIREKMRGTGERLADV